MAPADLAAVFAHIDEHRGAFLERLFAYLRIPGISAHGQGIGESAEFISGVLASMGLSSRIMPTEGWPMVLARHDGPAGTPTVLLYGHYDVQPPDPLDAWHSPPFEPVVRDGRIYARGVGDNKGQHFAHVLALESLLAVTGALPCGITVLLEGEEEIGSPRMPDFVRQHSEALRADLGIISDGTVHETGRSAIRFGVRGIVSFELKARGARSDLHSGNWGNVAPNPLWTLVHLLSTMKNDRGEVTIDGFYDNVLPQSEAEKRALSEIPENPDEVKAMLGLDRFDEPQGRTIQERLSAWPTFTINGLHGGYGGPGMKTVLPHEAFAKCDMRLVEAQSCEEIFSKVESHVRRHAPEVEFIRQGSMEPSKTPIDSPYTEPIRQGILAAQGEAPLRIPAMGGSLPEFVFTKTLGIPVFGVPYANIDEANHAPNENLELERFYTGIKTTAAMLWTLGQTGRAVRSS